MCTWSMRNVCNPGFEVPEHLNLCRIGHLVIVSGLRKASTRHLFCRMSRFRGQSGHAGCIAKCPLMTQSGHTTLCNEAHGPFSVTSCRSNLLVSDILRLLLRWRS